MRTSARHRRDSILAELYEKKEVTASSLSDLLGASEATVRRDLRALADEGSLELNYGGARLPSRVDFSYRSKAVRNVEAKRIIGQMAGELVAEGDQVFVDSGTTCFQLTPVLKRRRSLSVIVNSARLALELDMPHLDVILLGGHYRPDRMDTVGPLARAALDQLRGYKAFIGADGLSTDIGLLASDVESAFLFRQAVANARETTLLADHTKFLTPALCKIVGWEPIGRVVTDRRPSQEWMHFFQERNIEVIYPSAEPAEGQRE
jgi:DeoR/GlpR family transcriptional regulator of sugar metabolism